MTVGRTVVDMTMSSAYRAPPVLPGLEALPATSPPDLARYQILAGDLHCHVSPPDSPEEATRGIAETVALARSERLDFVVLTPHIGALFFTDDRDRRWTLAAREEMRAALAREDTSRTVFILGEDPPRGARQSSSFPAPAKPSSRLAKRALNVVNDP